MGALIPLGEWEDDAACREVPQELFFPKPGDPLTAVFMRSFCLLCPVQPECLEYALANPDLEGIWGGTTETDRRAIRRARNGYHPEMARAARPRKRAG